MTVAKTYIGTLCFLAPERIHDGEKCTPQSYVWALGLSMMEIAMGKFPFPTEVMSVEFDLMAYVIDQPSPTLPDSFSPEFQEFCRLCLIKDPISRVHPTQLKVN